MEWVAIGSALLSVLAPPAGQWKSLDANSERRQPVYYGKWPRELAIGVSPERPAAIEGGLRELLEENGAALARYLSKAIRGSAWEVEAWPIEDDLGQRVWAVARVRADPKSPWRFLAGEPIEGLVFPLTYDPKVPAHAKLLFADLLQYDDLYQKPLFGDCVWTDAEGLRARAAWLPAHAKRVLSDVVCRKISQPSRMADQPFTLVIGVSEKGAIRWPKGIRFLPERSKPPRIHLDASRVRFSEKFRDAYEEDVRVLAGTELAVFPKSGKRMRFTRKNSADPKNQLLLLISYLEERYAKLGIRTLRQPFVWRGIQQANLIAVLPGSLKGRANRPVVLADHIDTAFAEDTFRKTKTRVAVPGADDNVTAVASLLRAAEELAALPRKHDVWLVHLTGEEFPGDSLGARKFVSGLLAKKQDLGAVIQLDMIGYSRDRLNVFQISAGESRESQALASMAYSEAKQVAPRLKPMLRDRFDPKSYLYNTDGIVFSDNGYPVILLNEKLNAEEKIGRRHYHETTDTPDRIDWEFAVSISKVAIETVQRWAERGAK